MVRTTPKSRTQKDSAAQRKPPSAPSKSQANLAPSASTQVASTRTTSEASTDSELNEITIERIPDSRASLSTGSANTSTGCSTLRAPLKTRKEIIIDTKPSAYDETGSESSKKRKHKEYEQKGSLPKKARRLQPETDAERKNEKAFNLSIAQKVKNAIEKAFVAQDQRTNDLMERLTQRLDFKRRSRSPSSSRHASRSGSSGSSSNFHSCYPSLKGHVPKPVPNDSTRPSATVPQPAFLFAPTTPFTRLRSSQYPEVRIPYPGLDLVPEVKLLIRNSLSESTRKAHAEVIANYEFFAKSNGYQPFPATLKSISHWIAHLVKSVKVNTVQGYLAAIRNFHLENGLPLSPFDDPIIEKLFKGGKRIYDQSTKLECLTLT